LGYLEAKALKRGVRKATNAKAKAKAKMKAKAGPPPSHPDEPTALAGDPGSARDDNRRDGNRKEGIGREVLDQWDR
jgi:hypothetical protein